MFFLSVAYNPQSTAQKLSFFLKMKQEHSALKKKKR